MKTASLTSLRSPNRCRGSITSSCFSSWVRASTLLIAWKQEKRKQSGTALALHAATPERLAMLPRRELPAPPHKNLPNTDNASYFVALSRRSRPSLLCGFSLWAQYKEQ
ncbi:hypothetical protein VNO78_18177 [Psophocarpus tetragonolobus]|uniref:Uncharacterized protein n=1 Tax=Psophocarpus tetragonolobus TaxID=3891 RepID=A0AAN9SNZ9_PSOTE